MTFRIVLPDKQERTFAEEKSALVECSRLSSELNKILVVQEQKDGVWYETATVYPNGQIRKPVSISSIATSMPVRKRR